MRAFEAVAAGTWDETHQVDRVLLDFDARHRRRVTLRTETGASLLVDLPHAVRLKEGDGLRLTDGGVVRVAAKPEPLVEINAGSLDRLARIAWHLGNRHLPVQFHGETIRIRADHVIEDMVERLGGRLRRLEAPFDPEAGAYAGGHHHQHDEHDHEHDHGH